jgi:hypothetical protein
MKSQKKTSVKKKELRTALTASIAKALNIDLQDAHFKKLKKTVKEAAKEITKKYLVKIKKADTKAPTSKNKEAIKKPLKATKITVDKLKEMDAKKSNEEINL